MNVVALGLSHQTAPLEVRERLVLNEEESLEALETLRAEHGVPQSLLLSTCNRTEIYVVGERKERLISGAHTVFDPRLPSNNGDGREYLYTLHGQKAVEHLYRVAAGLDSLVIGEQQILGQVRRAYEISQSAMATGAILHRLMQGALRAGKRARTETAIGAGAISVASIAVELAEKVFGDLEGRSVLLVGAGENGEHTAQHLLARNIDRLLITNRTASRADALAARLGGQAVPFSEISEALIEADVVICTTGAPQPILDAQTVRRAMRARARRALVLLDIAVPRDIALEVDNIQNVFRFDMDALEHVVERNVARRRKEISRVEKLVTGEVDAFMHWYSSLDAGPVIRDLHRFFEEIRAYELERNVKRFSQSDREQLDLFSRTLIRKLLMGVTREIKGYRRDDPMAMERLAALRAVFNLEADKREEKEQDDA